MTVTASTRLGLTRWSAGTDPFTRAQMDASFAALDNLVAIDMQGLLAARPAAAVRGRYYWATDVNGGTLSRDAGTAWVNVGSVAYAVPVASAVGDAAAEGAGTTVARSDHRHAREAFGAVVAYTSGQASASGTASTVARSDHAHGFPTLGGVPVAVTPGDVAASGVGTTVALADHRHGVPAFGAAVTAETGWGGAAAVGIATTLARADHTHGSPITPVTSIAATGASTVNAGTGAVSITSPALASAVTAATTFGIASAVGTGTGIARNDHTHGTPPAPTATSVGAASTAGGDTITASGAGVVPLAVKGATGQTAALLAFQDGTGAQRASVGVGGAFVGTRTALTNDQPTAPGLVVRGAAGQSANLAEFQNSAGAVLASVNAAGGVLVAPDGTARQTNAGLEVHPQATNLEGLVVRGIASQAADLAQFRNSAGTVLAKVTAIGQLGSPVNIFGGVPLGLAFAEVGITDAGTRGLVVRGAAGQTANLAEFQNSAGTVLFSVLKDGRVAQQGLENAVFAAAAFQVSDLGSRGLVVRGIASGSQNLAEFQNSAGTVLARVDSFGNIVTGSAAAVGMLNALADNPNARPLIIRGAASQTRNLAEFQNSAGTVLASVNAGGEVTATFLSAGEGLFVRAFQIGTANSAGTGFRTVKVAN